MNMILWQDVYFDNKAFFEEQPLCEIVLSHMIGMKNMGAKDSLILNFLKAAYYCTFGLVNKKKKKESNKKGLFVSLLDRDNDWGIIWPLVCEFDRRNIPYYFVVSEECKTNHYNDILKLNNAEILSNSVLYKKINAFIQIQDIKEIIINKKIINKILKTYNIGNMVYFLSLYFTLVACGRGFFTVYFGNGKFTVSLGNQIFGVLYQLYGIKHYLIPHGTDYIDSSGYWNPFVRNNSFLILTYGSYFTNVYKRIYNAKCYEIGHVTYSSLKPLNNKKKKIVFFSTIKTVCGLVNGNKASYNAVWDEMSNILDEIICLYKDLSEEYEIAVKLHPGENDSLIRKHSDYFGNEIEIIQGDISSKSVLEDTMIAISIRSSIDLEAVCLGCLSVQRKFLPMFKYGKQDFSYYVESIIQIGDIINTGKVDKIIKKQQNILNRYYKKSNSVANDAIDLITNNF